MSPPTTSQHGARSRTDGPHRARPRAIVTGGAGFIGSHLVDRLIADGLAVLAIDDLSTGSAASLSGEAEFEHRDIGTARLDRLFRSWQPDVVFHLAAQASVPMSLRDPMRDLRVNVIGTHRVARATRDAGAQRIVFVSSGGAVYGETRHPATERTIPAPTSYYGIHKLAGEGHIAVGGVPYQIARPANVYGPRQAAGLEGAVVAAFLDQSARDGGLVIHGDGRQTRDLVHVLDVVDAFVRLASTSTACRIWNVASDRSVTIRALAEIIEQGVGHPLRRSYSPRRPGDVRHSYMSATRLRQLGWSPTVDLEAGIRGLIGSGGRSS